jgi:hypothetical protein
LLAEFDDLLVDVHVGLILALRISTRRLTPDIVPGKYLARFVLTANCALPFSKANPRATLDSLVSSCTLSWRPSDEGRSYS